MYAANRQATHLFAFRDIDFHELVYCFFKVELVVSTCLHRKSSKGTYRVHDGQIDRPSEIDQIRLGHVHNTLLLRRYRLFVRIIRILFTS